MLFVFIYSIQVLFHDNYDDDCDEDDDDDNDYGLDMKIISYKNFFVYFAFICHDFVSACIFCGAR